MKMEKKNLRRDIRSEWQYGYGAIRTCGKILLSDIGREGADFDKTLILGVIAENLLSQLKNTKGLKGNFYKGEMWEAELIIIPKRKFVGHKEELGWDTQTADQKLGGNWANRDMWKKELKTPKNKDR